MENMAYKKQTWTNDRNRHQQSTGVGELKLRSARETNGDPSLAVDGMEESLDWSKCATIDNYFVRKPVWMVDLGRVTNVAGVMLRTWHGNNKGRRSKSIIEINFCTTIFSNKFIRIIIDLSRLFSKFRSL